MLTVSREEFEAEEARIKDLEKISPMFAHDLWNQYVELVTVPNPPELDAKIRRYIRRQLFPGRQLMLEWPTS